MFSANLCGYRIHGDGQKGKCIFTSGDMLRVAAARFVGLRSVQRMYAWWHTVALNRDH
jgi:hypothetical protein